MTKRRVLIVCSGNTCRSPMAGGLLRLLASQSGVDLEVRTCGLYAQVGDGPAPNAVLVMREIGVDISDHQPTQLDVAAVDWANIILVVDHQYGEAIAEEHPAAGSKIQTLDRDVLDPYCQPVAIYRKCRDELRGALLQLMPALIA